MIVIGVGSHNYNLKLRVVAIDRTFVWFDDGFKFFARSVLGVGEDVRSRPELWFVVVFVHEIRNFVVQIDYESVGLSGLCGGYVSLS